VRRSVKFILLTVVSLLILGAILWVTGFEETMGAVGEAGVLAFAGAGATFLATLLLRACVWSLLNRPIGHRVRLRTLLAAEVVGQAGNVMTPSTYLGGEPLKVVYVGRVTGHPYTEVAGTVLLCKYLEMLSFVLFFGAATVVAAVSFGDVLFTGASLVAGVSLLAVAAALLVLFVVLWVALSKRWRPLTRLIRGVARLGLFTRRLARLGRRTRAMEDQVSRVFCEQRRSAMLGLVTFMGTHVLIVARPAVFFWLGARMGMGLGELCLIFVVCQGLLCFQVTPGGVGTLDAGLMGIFTQVLEFPGPQCMAYLLCIRFWDACVIGAGALLATRAGARFLTAQPPPEGTLLPPDPQGAEDDPAGGSPPSGGSTDMERS
jgi:uncharacterized protein (TIRG00374 family)